MQKTSFRTKVIAAAAACAMSAGIVALSAAPAQANSSQTITSTQSTIEIQNNVICNYTVSAAGGLWVRDAPAGDQVYSLDDGSNARAYQNRTQSEDGILWRQLADGNWAAANYLNWDGSDCLV